MEGWNSNKLGFGLMRLPKKGDEIDLEATAELVDAFLAGGGTYFDTAYVYAGSEVAFRETIAKRHPRDSYTIASKVAGWILNDEFTVEKSFRESLERCGIEYFDYYLLHSVQGSRVPMYEKFGCWDFCREMVKEGRIRHFGFSFHGDPPTLERLLDEHPETEFVQMQLNYVDWENEAICCAGNYEVCRRRGVDIIVMEPVKGGMLASLKPELEDKLRALDPDATPSSFAMRYVGALPGVKVVLSGMNTHEQLQDNLRTFRDLRPLTEAERKAVHEVRDGILAADTVPCTSCRYCVSGCPQSINIPEIFKAYNLILTFGDHLRPHLYYNDAVDLGSGRASDCIGCGQCEGVCPQHINIIERLAGASEKLDV